MKEGGFAPFDWRMDGGDGGRISTGNVGSAGSGTERPVAGVAVSTSNRSSSPIEIRSHLSQSRVVFRYLVQIDGDLGWMVVEFDRYAEGND